jgi:hypothetical protein
MWALIFAGIGMAVGAGITFAFLQQRGIQQGELNYSDENSWLDPLFLQSYNEKVRVGSHYRSQITAGEESFFRADARGGKEPHQFEWKFDDGIVLTTQNVTRSFDSIGKHTVQLTVTDAGDQHVGQQIRFEVIPVD